MFDIGFSELFLIGVVALIVLGPERLPKAARFVGLWVRRARAQWYSVKSELEHELADEELRRSLRATQEELRSAHEDLRAQGDAMRSQFAAMGEQARAYDAQLREDVHATVREGYVAAPAGLMTGPDPSDASLVDAIGAHAGPRDAHAGRGVTDAALDSNDASAAHRDDRAMHHGLDREADAPTRGSADIERT